MIAAVAETLGNRRDRNDKHRDGSNLLVCEAPTGTGKTASGLLAGLVLGKSRGQALIYSSSTVALQEQLVRKDIPMFEALMPFAFTTAIAKGRARYVCVAKLTDFAGDAAQQRMVFSAERSGTARYRIRGNRTHAGVAAHDQGARGRFLDR